MSRRGSRLPRDLGRGASSNNMARTMEIFKIPIPPLLNPSKPVTAVQNNGLQGLPSPGPVSGEQSTNKRGRTSSDPLPPAQNKRGLIRVVTDMELEKIQVSGAHLSTDQVASCSPVAGIAGITRAADANLEVCASNVVQSKDLTASPGENVKVPAMHGAPTYVAPPVTPTPVGSLNEVLEHVFSVDSGIVGLTISMRMKNGDTMVVNGDL